MDRLFPKNRRHHLSNSSSNRRSHLPKEFQPPTPKLPNLPKRTPRPKINPRHLPRHHHRPPKPIHHPTRPDNLNSNPHSKSTNVNPRLRPPKRSHLHHIHHPGFYSVELQS